MLFTEFVCYSDLQRAAETWFPFLLKIQVAYERVLSSVEFCKCVFSFYRQVYTTEFHSTTGRRPEMCLCSPQEHSPYQNTFNDCGFCESRCAFSLLQAMVPAAQTSLLLQPLLSDTEYRLSVSAVYSDGNGPPITRIARTRESALH